MDTYSILREFADSWVLLAMFAFFVGVGIWAFLPSQAPAREDARMIPFRNENGPKPAVRTDPGATAPCTKNCPDCACKGLARTLKGLDDE